MTLCVDVLTLHHIGDSVITNKLHGWFYVHAYTSVAMPFAQI